MRIRWTPAAAADLQHIGDYLKDHHPHYRQPTVRRLYEGILFPPLPYVAVYRVKEQSIEVVRIYHGAQDRP